MMRAGGTSEVRAFRAAALEGWAVGCLVFVLSGLLAASASGGESARQILDRAKALDDGPRWWDDREQRLQLEVVVGSADPMRLELLLFDLKRHGRRQWSLVEFVAPASKAGVALLAHTVGGAPARQWLYTPATKRVRQVAKAGKRNRFDVTDFTYHDLDVLTDLLNWTAEETGAVLGGEGTVSGAPCHVIELTPRLQHVVYPRVLLWLGKDDLVPRQVEFFELATKKGWFAWLFGDESGGGEPVRRYRQSDVRTIGNVPVAHRIEVETPAEKSRTTIRVERVRFNQGLDESFFHPHRLETRGK
jgi:hypothetical protein